MTGAGAPRRSSPTATGRLRAAGFSGTKIAVVLAVAGAIVGELVGSAQGLGYLMPSAQGVLDTAGRFMAVVLVGLIGVALYGLVILLERLVVVTDARTE